MIEPEYLNLHQLSSRMGVSTRTLRYWATDPVNPLPAYRPRRKLLFKWSEVVRWLELQRLQPVDAAKLAQDVLESMKENAT